LRHLLAGSLEEAQEAFIRYLSIAPNSAPTFASLAYICWNQCRFDCALRNIKSAIALRPENDAYLHNRAVVLTAMQRYQEALRDYERALELNPHSAGTHNNLAWLLATAPDPSLRDGVRAVEHARQALDKGVNGSWLDTLAAALAESGEYDQAVEVEQHAFELSQPKNESFRQRIEIYRQHMSYATWRQQRTIERTEA
jgi:tetratricopeptide (TPR) repeat protein